MKKILILPAMLIATGAHAVDIGTALNNVRTACSGISSDMEHLKKMAGINTAITAVGTVAGGVAVGTGIAKSNVDEEIRKMLKDAEDNMSNAQDAQKEIDVPVATQEQIVRKAVAEGGGNAEKQLAALKDENKSDADTKQSNLEQKSKTLGNIRTGTLAANTATNVASAIIAGNNQVKGVLEERIAACRARVKELNDAYMQARMDNPGDVRVAAADKIVSACGKWDNVDIDKINKKAKGSMITSGVGATVGAAGTIASVMANSKKPTDANADKLNTKANVMAGGATVASGVATVLNATQIKVIKNAVEVADNCEEALQ